jgi:hypothetical protein
MPLPLEYYLFRQYSIAVKEWLQKNCHLASYPENENVLVAYMTPDMAFGKYIYPVMNGQTFRPVIGFRLVTDEYKEGENLLGFVREYSRLEGTGGGRLLKPPLVYGLTYGVTVYTKAQSEMDLLHYQILSKAHKNAKAVMVVDGQWAEMVASNPRDETNLEPGEAQDLVKRSALDLTIMRAYLPLDYTEVKEITDFEAEYDIV